MRYSLFLNNLTSNVLYEYQLYKAQNLFEEYFSEIREVLDAVALLSLDDENPKQSYVSGNNKAVGQMSRNNGHSRTKDLQTIRPITGKERGKTGNGRRKDGRKNVQYAQR